MKAFRLVHPSSVPHTTPCRLTSPTGEVFVVYGLKTFAVLFGLNPTSLKQAAKSGGKLQGWQVEQLDHEAVTEVTPLWDHPELAIRMKAAKTAGKFERARS